MNKKILLILLMLLFSVANANIRNSITSENIKKNLPYTVVTNNYSFGISLNNTINMNNNSILDVKYIDFNLNTTVDHKEGRSHWNGEDGVPEVGLSGGNVRLQIGLESLLRGTNKIGSDLLDGRAVYVSGSQGGRPTLEYANNSNAASSCVVAVMTETVENNTSGYATIIGEVNGIDTSDFNDGDEVWLNSIDGKLIATKPIAPSRSVRIGYILRSHETEGRLMVNIERIPVFTDLSDVYMPDLDGGEIALERCK